MAQSKTWLPCICDTQCRMPPRCGHVFYGPQDIAKAERLATEAGFDGFRMAYRQCDACRWTCGKETE